MHEDMLAMLYYIKVKVPSIHTTMIATSPNSGTLQSTPPDPPKRCNCPAYGESKARHNTLKALSKQC